MGPYKATTEEPRCSSDSPVACAAFSWNTTQGRLDAQKIAGLAFTRAFPSHDHGLGLSKGEVDAFAASLRA